MLKTSPDKTNTRNYLIGSLFVASVGLTQAAAATPQHYTASPDPIDKEFRASHPIKVFVDVAQETRSRSDRPSDHRSDHRSRADAADYYVRDLLHYQIPSHIVLVSNRRDADMTVKARLLDYDLSFHITDVDRRDKKYKKSYRYTGGKCGQHKRGYYTRVTEKGVALADYQLSVRLKGIGTYSDTARIRAAESYRYGEKLSALTNCGVAPTVHYPNKTVAKLFTRAGGAYRDTVAHQVREESLRNLSHVLANTIRGRSDQFYAELANQYAGAPRSRSKHSDRFDSRRADHLVYDGDDVDADTYQRKEKYQW